MIGWFASIHLANLHAAPPWPSYIITNFNDEFDGFVYDTNTWAIYDSRTNLTVSDGYLHLNTILQGTNWTAAGVYSRTYHQRFGYFETRMQVARDDGLNNAFWLNSPFDFSNPYDQLEIDITEAHYHNEQHMTVHDWKPTHVSTGNTLAVTNIYPGFHTVGLEWTRNGTLNFFWDGTKVYTFSATALNAYNSMMPMQIMFSTKVIPWAGTPGTNLDGSSMDVDYARAWQKPGWLGTTNGNWGTTANWGPDGIPAAGDAAIFNGASANHTISLAGDKPVKEIYFGHPTCSAYTLATGYNLQLGTLASGTGIGGVTINGDVINPQTIATTISAQNSLVFANFSTKPGASLNLTGLITSSQTNRTLYFAGPGQVNLAGSLSAQVEDVIRYNSGELWLLSSNAHTGTTLVQNGTVIVAANGALGWENSNAPTIVSNGGTLALAANVNYTLPETILINGSGEVGRQGALDLRDGSSVTLACPVFLSTNATIASGDSNGTFSLLVPIDITTNGYTLTLRGNGTTVFYAPIIGTGNVTKSGTGSVIFQATNTYTGNLTISQGSVIGNTRTLTRNLSNSGTMVFDQDFDGSLTNIISGSGSLSKQGAGTLTILSANTHSGPTTISNGTLRIGADERISGSSDLMIVGGTFDLNGYTESLGDVTLVDGYIINSTGSSAQYLGGASYTLWNGTVSARLGGSGHLVKTGPRLVTMSGGNTFLGGGTVSNGTFHLTGSLNSSVTVEGGTFSGTGTVNSHVIINGGTHAPGASPGTMTIKSNYTLATNGTLEMEIQGTGAGTQYDQLKLTSTSSIVNLAGTLRVIATNNLPANSSFILITNIGSSAVVGTFAGKPQGSVFYASGYWWRISYSGGNGNDVVLTRISPPKPSLSLAITNQLPQLNIAGDLGPAYQLQVSPDLWQWTNLFLTNPSSIPFTWSDSNWGTLSNRFFRVLIFP